MAVGLQHRVNVHENALDRLEMYNHVCEYSCTHAFFTFTQQ